MWEVWGAACSNFGIVLVLRGRKDAWWAAVWLGASLFAVCKIDLHIGIRAAGTTKPTQPLLYSPTAVINGSELALFC